MKLRLIPILILAFATTAAIGQESFSTIEERMSGKEFSETGLSKLTPQELAALNQWLRSHSVATLETARYASGDGSAATDTRGFGKAREPDSDEPIISPIKGSFSGWRGKGTVFELENGMAWQTDEQSEFFIPAREGVVATIEKGLFGSWRLQVEGYNTSVRVKRIR